jgi:transposase-like protein
MLWLWAAIEPKHREILRIDVSVERAILVAERFIASLTNRYGRHPVSTDGGHLVSASMQVPETETPFAFPF